MREPPPSSVIARLRAGLAWAWDAAQFLGMFVSVIATLIYSPALFSAIHDSEPWLIWFYLLAIPGIVNFRRLRQRLFR